ncbi:hypothetical protein IFM89_035694 [Coptis chinensis]|uniref:VQ domain-containing protein n=1 Tax=Coptis chinensis TaxID=261450 RepID=A0A835IT95_9MAGN|nr:hypothetical protein IFM89_035694 [Coptis chinensis]
MDSGNSGSLQSSSGGDDEYDSRNESISAFLNPSSSSHVGVLGNPQQPPPPSSLHHHHHHHQNPTSLFDPLSNYFDVFSSSRSTPPPNPNSPLNLDVVWSRNLRSEPNSTDMGAIMGSSSSIMASTTHQDVNRVIIQTPPSSVSLPQGADTSVKASASSSDPTNVTRTSKKRSRASRRAPTTVLTTDTSNFRAMVQEFTGIPAPPFSASPFPRSRLDLFSTASTMRSGHLEPNRPPPYLLRPFAQKPSPFASSNMSPGIASNTPSTNNMSTTNTTSSNNYQLLSELGLSKQSQNLVNMQNPLLTFQSLLQSTIPPKYPSPNSSGFGDNSQGILSNTRMGTLDEFNMNHGQVRTHLNELPNFGTSDGMRNDNNFASNCGDGVGSNDGDQGQARSFNENYGNSQRANSCKLNFSGSSSHEKGTENVTSRGGEGMVDSWICSSD